MSAKAVVFLCIQALLANAIYAQFFGGVLSRSLGGNAFNSAGNGIGMSGNGIGMSGNGIGMSGNGIGVSGNGIGMSGNALGLGTPMNTASVHNSGGFTVTSSSPIAPSGVSVVTEYVIEAPVPVKGAVAIEAQGIMDEAAVVNAAASNAVAAANSIAANPAVLGASAAGLRPSTGVY